MKTLLIAALLFVGLGTYVQAQSHHQNTAMNTFDYCYKSAPNSPNESSGHLQESCSFHVHFIYPKYFVQNTLTFCSNVVQDAINQSKINSYSH